MEVETVKLMMAAASNRLEQSKRDLAKTRELCPERLGVIAALEADCEIQQKHLDLLKF